MKKEMIIKEVEQWYKICRKCKKKIIGRSESQAKYNFSRHVEACNDSKK